MADDLSNGSVYTPTHVVATPSIGGSIGVEIGRAMWDRSSTVHRTMRRGPTNTNNWFRTFFGTRQTADEMRAFQNIKSPDGKSAQNLFGFNWREHVWGNQAVDQVMHLGGRGSIMGTPWSPSSWVSAMDIVRGKGNHGMMNVAFGRQITDDVISGVDIVPGRFKVNGAGMTIPFGAEKYTRWSERLEAGTPFANSTLDRFLGIGTQASKSNIVRDYTLGKLFNVKNGFEVSEKFTESSLLRGAYESNTVLQTGAAIAEHGGGAISDATALGLGMRGLYMAGGAALRAFAWYTTARDVAKIAYKGAEAYFYKAPMAAYTGVANQMTRGAFASGDASLLTGIPANNRMRAVQAIQGSRMNARSALGGEASLLSGHFG